MDIRQAALWKCFVLLCDGCFSCLLLWLNHERLQSRCNTWISVLLRMGLGYVIYKPLIQLQIFKYEHNTWSALSKSKIFFEYGSVFEIGLSLLPILTIREQNS